jgi:hypothetical protein
MYEKAKNNARNSDTSIKLCEHSEDHTLEFPLRRISLARSLRPRFGIPRSHLLEACDCARATGIRIAVRSVTTRPSALILHSSWFEVHARSSSGMGMLLPHVCNRTLLGKSRPVA